MSASSPSPSSAAAATAAPMSLKQRIHNFKIPLSPRGLRIARIVYFTAPLVIGVIVMQAAMGYEEHHRVRTAQLEQLHSNRGTVAHLLCACVTL